MLTKINNDILLEIHKKACVCRAFEEEVFRLVQNKTIPIPVYLSAGQEYISATLSVFLRDIEPQIFIQHRGHSIYLNFGGDIKKLALELLGDSAGCANGMGGSASIQSKEKKIFGHDGLMGSQGPIATGACYANKQFTLCFSGDAAAEEDYFISSIGWAATKKIPIWYVIEDNNFSILTPKNDRRSWHMHDLANAFGMKGIECKDDPCLLWEELSTLPLNKPALLNILTNRLFWHAGAGIDDPDLQDIHKKYTDFFGEQYSRQAKMYVNEIWQQCLK